MPNVASISKALDLVGWIAEQVHETQFPASPRNRLAAACFAVAQEHHHAIVFLLKERLNGSAFALVRPLFESYIRGLWLTHCATDQELEHFSKGEEPPKIGALLAAIEKTPAFDEKRLSQIKAQSWNSLCSYTHTGSLQLQRWNTSEAVEPNYSPEEIDEVLSFANMLALLSALGIAAIADNDALGQSLLEKTKCIYA